MVTLSGGPAKNNLKLRLINSHLVFGRKAVKEQGIALANLAREKGVLNNCYIS